MQLYACRSQKCKKQLDLTVFFALLVSVGVKAARKLMVKLTPGCSTNIIDPINIVTQGEINVLVFNVFVLYYTNFNALLKICAH